MFIHLQNCLHLQIPSSQSFPPPPCPPWNHTSVLCESVSVLWISSCVSHLRFHIEGISYNICLSDFLHLSGSCLPASMLLQMALFHFSDWVTLHPICVYHIFFTGSSVSGHLGRVYVWAVVNSAAVNIGGTCIFFSYILIWVYAQKWYCWITWKVYFFFRFS